MAAYIIADVTVTNEAQMVNYREWSTRAMQEFGAEVLVRGGMPAALEGAWRPQRMVVLKFKDRTTAQAYYSRIHAAKDDRQALDECLPMARALFGEELEKALDKLNRQFWSVQVMVDANMKDRGNVDAKFREKIDSAIYEGYPTEEENAIDKSIKEQVRFIEEACVPILRLELPKRVEAKVGAP